MRQDFLNPVPGPKCAAALQDTVFASAVHCTAESGYSFWVVRTPPTPSEATQICKSETCRRLVGNMLNVAPSECVTTDGFYLYADMLNPVLQQCAAHVKSEAEPSSSSTTTTIVMVVAVVLVVIGGGLLYLRRHRRRGQSVPVAALTQFDEEAQRYERTPYASPVTNVSKTKETMPQTHWTIATDEIADSTALSRPARPFGGYAGTSTRSVDLASIPLLQYTEILRARIPFEEVEITSHLDDGAYGSVYVGSFRAKAVAIKKLRASHASDVTFISKFLEEVRLMASLSHPRIVTFIGVAWTKPEDISAVIEYMEGGDLLSLLRKLDQDKTKRPGFDRMKLTIALHVAEALAYLHARSPVVIHRDLKSNNILLNSQYDAKITDFGVSREHADAAMTMKVGTQRWMAPEIINGEDYNTKADVFSFGVVLSELDTNKIPYATHDITDMPPLAVMQSIARGQLTVEFSYASDPRIVALGHECVSLDPARRPTMDDARRRIQAVLE